MSDEAVVVVDSLGSIPERRLDKRSDMVSFLVSEWVDDSDASLCVLRDAELVIV